MTPTALRDLIGSALIPGLLAALAALILTPAAADIAPPLGKKRVLVEFALEALPADAFADYALFLVSTNAREWWQLQVKPVSRDGGPLNIPSRYMDRTILAALTPAQQAELARLALPLAQFAPDRDALAALDDAALAAHFASITWATSRDDMTPAQGKPRAEIPLMAFFMRGDVATTPTLLFMAEVSELESANVLTSLLRVAKIQGGELLLNELRRGPRDDKGQWLVSPPPDGDGGGDGSAWGLWLGLAFVAAGVVLTLTLRRHPPTATRPTITPQTMESRP